MSDLPGEALTYQTVVAEYFLGLRGGGLMLSPLDEELVRTWERRGLPIAVVCRGIRRGVEDAIRLRGPGAPPPRSIRAYRLAVEDEWTAYRAGRVGNAPPPPDEASAASRRLESARALLAKAASRTGTALAARQAYRAAGAVLDAVPPGIGLDALERTLRRADDALVRGWLAAMPRPERTAIGRRCTEHAGARQAWVRRVDHRAVLRAYLIDAAREAGLLCLRGSV